MLIVAQILSTSTGITALFSAKPMRYLLLISLFLIITNSAEATQPLAYGEEPQVGRTYSVYAKADNVRGHKWSVSELGSRIAMGQLPYGTRILLMYKHKSIIVDITTFGQDCCKYHMGLSRSVTKAFGMKNTWKGRLRIVVLSTGTLGPTKTYEDPENTPIILY